ncbi:MAG: hypothetical protein WC702_04420 [Patescibacteria group bacterium]|jgi:hypothetical protein
MLSERTKKILIVAGFVASVIGIGTALYFMFLAPSTTTTPTTETNETPSNIGGLPTTGLGQPTVGTTEGETILPEASEVAHGGLTETTMLTAAAVTDVALSSDGKSMNYYDQSDNRFYTIASNGTVTKLSNKQFPDVEDTAWNNDGSKAVIEFPDGSNIVYNFTDETQVTLPQHWEDFEFSPNQDQIIAKSITVDSDSSMLVVSNEDGSQTQAVQALGNNADKVQINPSPTDQIIAFSDTAGDQGGFGQKMIYPIGKNQENFKGLTVEGLGFESLWSPRGDILLYSTYSSYSDYKPLLWVVDGSVNSIGDNRRSAGLNTWVDKCVFAGNDVIYCGIPQSLETNAGMQRTLYKKNPDDLYKIDLSTGRSSLIARPAEDAAMENLQVTDDGSLLYFTNAIDGRLGYIKLK